MPPLPCGRLLDRGNLGEGATLLAGLANDLLPHYGSTLSRTVRDRLFEIAIPAIDSVQDRQQALALCNSILYVQEAGNEQNMPAREREERVRLKLLTRKVALASVLGAQDQIDSALAELGTWFPTEELTVEANRIAAKAREGNASALASQLTLEAQARAVLQPSCGQLPSLGEGLRPGWR